MAKTNDPLEKWLQSHQMSVVDVNYRNVVSSIPLFDLFRNPDDYNRIEERYARYETETYYVVNVPERQLRKIQEFEDQVFGNMKNQDYGHYNLFEVLMQQKEEERDLRKKYPAVQNAYEQYSLMLKLAKSGDI